MISLEQVRALESRVEKAVALIASLRTENASLRSGLAAADSRVAELEGLIADFQKDQERIEEGIVEALRKLDSFEDAVHGAVSASKTAPETTQRDSPPAAAEPEPEVIEDAITDTVTAVSSDDGADALDIF